MKWRSNRRENVKNDTLTQFTISDEMEFQRLKAKFSEGNSFLNPETGVIDYKEIKFEDYPDRLKELHSKRESISKARILEQTFIDK